MSRGRCMRDGMAVGLLGSGALLALSPGSQSFVSCGNLRTQVSTPSAEAAAAARHGAELPQATGACQIAAGVAVVSALTRRRQRATTTRRAEARDAVTGTKFEEEDEKKNPQRRAGHQVKGMGEVDPETAARQQRIREHQEGCQRLSWPEEIKTLMAQPKGFAVLSTISKKGETEGFPVGSIVGFATDEKGRPIFCFSGMSSHTGNVVKDSRASLCVTEQDFRGAADARVVLTGKVTAVAKDEQDAVREQYLAKHPGAYWVNFGDFTMFRMDEVLDVAFVGGFARAGGITVQEYYDAEVDPCLAFSAPVMTHMNDDHEESIKSYVQYLVGAGEVDGAKMKRLDRYGFDCRVMSGGQEGVLRVPFPEPVTERKDIKTAIMQLSKKVASIQQAEEAEA